jgi:hypothetical protein
MSVIIHGMEMPKSCDECRLFNECWCMALGIENWRKSYNKPPEGERLPDCPLVPLPEGHGRLIDADALERVCKEIADCEWNKKTAPYSWEYAYNQFIGDEISDAPTIIEADLEWKMKNCCCFSNTDHAEGGTGDGA